jgi:hypothetical protein
MRVTENGSSRQFVDKNTFTRKLSASWSYKALPRSHTYRTGGERRPGGYSGCCVYTHRIITDDVC